MVFLNELLNISLLTKNEIKDIKGLTKPYKPSLLLVYAISFWINYSALFIVFMPNLDLFSQNQQTRVSHATFDSVW